MNSSITGELQIDQSVAHNGICLTVVVLNDTLFYTVTAIDETIKNKPIRLEN
jgi:riboflavin synthase